MNLEIRKFIEKKKMHDRRIAKNLLNSDDTAGSQVQKVQLRTIAIFVRIMIENIRFS